jgi:transaldolase
LLKVCKKKPISFEVFGDTHKQMLHQAMIINSWGKNIYVKVPVVNSKGLFSGKVIKILSSKGIKLNITAVYTIHQVKKILKNLNKNSKTIISIFSGRMADAGKDPVPIIKKSVYLAKKIKKVEILWASTREAYNYLQAKDCECSIITMPPAIIKKISSFGKTYENLTLDTVKAFLQDSKNSNFKI